MIKGIGIDTVETARIARILQSETAQPFLLRTFTDAERSAAPEHPEKRAEYFAARFAAKEASFKAVAPLLKNARSDPQLVEALNRPDGSPYIGMTAAARALLKGVGVKTLHLSITTEGGLATAFVVAEGQAAGAKNILRRYKK